MLAFNTYSFQTIKLKLADTDWNQEQQIGENGENTEWNEYQGALYDDSAWTEDDWYVDWWYDDGYDKSSDGHGMTILFGSPPVGSLRFSRRHCFLSYVMASRLLQRSSCLEPIQNRKGVERTAASDQKRKIDRAQGRGRNDHRPFRPKNLLERGTPTESISERVRGLQPSASVISGLSQKRILLEFLTRKFFRPKRSMIVASYAPQPCRSSVFGPKPYAQHPFDFELAPSTTISGAV